MIRPPAIRAKVEPLFRAIRHQFGYTKVRYRGLAKNTARLFTLSALSNIRRVKKLLMQRVQGWVQLQTAKGL